MQSIAVTTSACIISKEIRVYNWCVCIIFSKYDTFGKNWFCNDFTEIWFRYVNMEFSDQYNWSTKHNLCSPAKTITDLITEVNRIHSQMLHFTLTVYIIKSINQWKVWIWGTYHRIFHNTKCTSYENSYVIGYTTLYVHEDVYFQWMHQLLYLFYFCNTVTKVIC